METCFVPNIQEDSYQTKTAQMLITVGLGKTSL